MEWPDPPLLLDLRTREEQDAVTIPGATPANETIMQRLFSSPKRDRFIVLFDHKGQNALDAASYFLGHEFTHVKVLKGGIDLYSVEADPTLPRYELETVPTA
jgi:rhodanese-related sulfurtransferase